MTAFAIESAGTVMLTAGQTTLVGTGTAFNLAAVSGGIIICGDGIAHIVSVESDTSATLGLGWPGTTQTNQPYAIFRATADAAFLMNAQDRVSEAIRVMKRLEGQSLFNANAAGDAIAERDAFDGEEAGFVFVLVPAAGQTGPAEAYTKLSATLGHWSGATTLEGSEGPPGPPGPAAFDFTGFGAPSDAQGVDGQTYLNQTNGDTYLKAAGTWGTPSGSIAGAGFTGGSYDAGTGVVTFTSDDGIGFQTGDLRGDDGIDGLGWTGASYDPATGILTFTSDDGLGIQTDDLRGADGLDGADGSDPGILLTWNTGTADADPGAGNLWADNADLSAATQLFASKTGRGGNAIASFLLDLADSTSTIKGHLTVTDPATDAQIIWQVTGVTDATGYVKVAVQAHAGATSFANALPVSFQFTRTGDAGEGAVSSVNGQAGVVVLDADDIDDAATAHKFASVDQLAKVDHLTVTQAVDLDAIETRVNELDAAIVLMGVWDASAGTFPGAGAAQAGQSWIVSVAGTVNGVAFAVNDRVIAIADNASTATYASNWHKADYTDQVLSVAGLVGAISAAGLRTALDIANYAEWNTAFVWGDHALAGYLTPAAIGVSVQPFDADTLKADTSGQLAAGFTGTDSNPQIVSSGTFTPDPEAKDSNFIPITNGGAFVLAAPSKSGQVVLHITNNASAGAIDTTAYADVDGASFNTINGAKFLGFITRVAGDSYLTIKELP